MHQKRNVYEIGRCYRAVDCPGDEQTGDAVDDVGNDIGFPEEPETCFDIGRLFINESEGGGEYRG